METTHLIAASDFCTHYRVSYQVIESLREAGLVEIVMVSESAYIREEDLGSVEKLVRFYTELEINVAGIEVISRLLDRMGRMEAQLRALQQRLRIYERD